MKADHAEAFWMALYGIRCAAEHLPKRPGKHLKRDQWMSRLEELYTKIDDIWQTANAALEPYESERARKEGER